MVLIDADWCRKKNACYSNGRLNTLFECPITVHGVLTRRDGLWVQVPDFDRMWVFWRAVDEPTALNTLEAIVTRLITNHTLYCGVKSVESWVRQWLSRKDRSYVEAFRAAEAAEAADKPLVVAAMVVVGEAGKVAGAFHYGDAAARVAGRAARIAAQARALYGDDGVSEYSLQVKDALSALGV